MWARRCGAPPGWPSRVKVIFFSFFSGTLGLAIYTYMAGSNISYLDLENGSAPEVKVMCLQNWPVRYHRISWTAPPQEWFRQFFDFGGPKEMIAAQSKQCNTSSLAIDQCSRIVVPVSQMKRPLALAMGSTVDGGLDVLGAWSKFFLLLTFAIWVGVTMHDLALIGKRKKHFILDVTGINEHCPSIRKTWRAMAGLVVLKRLVTQENVRLRMLGIGIAVVLAPILIVWNLVVFNFFIVPLLMLAFLRYPIRMSRAWVFTCCMASCLYGLGLAFQMLGLIANPSVRPRYAVTWTTDTPLPPLEGGAPVNCVCGCDYPVSFSVTVNLLIIGVLTAIKSIFLAFRCLKGLRRSQWANLLSVMFPVPITMYSVDWKLPSGMPIRFRTEGVPVQGEIAFDPFAMMDEQLDSASMTINMQPEPVHRYHINTESGELDLVEPTRHLETPAIPMPAFSAHQLQVRKVEYIGCCGFPWPTGGKQYVYDEDFVAKLEEGGSEAIAADEVACDVEDADLAVPFEGRENDQQADAIKPAGKRGGDEEKPAGDRSPLAVLAAEAAVSSDRSVAPDGAPVEEQTLMGHHGLGLSAQLPPVLLKRL